MKLKRHYSALYYVMKFKHAIVTTTKRANHKRITNIPLFLEITITLYHLTEPLFYIMAILRLASNDSPKKAIQLEFPSQIIVVFELQSSFRSYWVVISRRMILVWTIFILSINLTFESIFIVLSFMREWTNAFLS